MSRELSLTRLSGASRSTASTAISRKRSICSIRSFIIKKRIALNMRLGAGSLLNRVRDDEWNDVVEVAVAMCKDHGIDIERAINSVNSELVSA